MGIDVGKPHRHSQSDVTVNSYPTQLLRQERLSQINSLNMSSLTPSLTARKNEIIVNHPTKVTVTTHHLVPRALCSSAAVLQAVMHTTIGPAPKGCRPQQS
jgi:hypothetical protein